jgi:hypothetical protein
MRRTVLLLASMALGVLLASGVAQAIINGQPDRGAHPYVGMVYNAKYLCSGTLISPRVFLTAAHCTKAFEEGASKVRVTFEQRADFEPDEAYVGIPHTHPRYDGSSLDVGVVVLKEALRTGDGYGKLPEANLVERFRTGKKLTVVGYGTRDFRRGGGPPEPTGFAIRYRGSVVYLGTNGADNGYGVDSYIKTREASAGEGGEGTCFGDSGGPYFLPSDQRTIVAVTSFGLNGVCAGAGYAQRVDLPVVLRWVKRFP